MVGQPIDHRGLHHILNVVPWSAPSPECATSRCCPTLLPSRWRPPDLSPFFAPLSAHHLSVLCAMAKLALALVLAALLAVAFAQVELLNPVGRGFVIGDAQHAPCGQSVTHSVPANQVQWHKSTLSSLRRRRQACLPRVALLLVAARWSGFI